MLMVSPMVYLLSNVTERHLFLTTTVGAVFLEVEAMNSIQNFVNFSIAAVLISIPLQIALYWMYNLIGHPWKRFIYEIYVKEETQFPGMVRQANINVYIAEKNEETKHVPRDNFQLEAIVNENAVSSKGIDEEIESYLKNKDDIQAIIEIKDTKSNDFEMNELSMDQAGVDNIDTVLEMLREIIEF